MMGHQDDTIESRWRFSPEVSGSSRVVLDMIFDLAEDSHLNRGADLQAELHRIFNDPTFEEVEFVCNEVCSHFGNDARWDLTRLMWRSETCAAIYDRVGKDRQT